MAPRVGGCRSPGADRDEANVRAARAPIAACRKRPLPSRASRSAPPCRASSRSGAAPAGASPPRDPADLADPLCDTARENSGPRSPAPALDGGCGCASGASAPPPAACACACACARTVSGPGAAPEAPACGAQGAAPCASAADARPSEPAHEGSRSAERPPPPCGESCALSASSAARRRAGDRSAARPAVRGSALSARGGTGNGG
jgi:hypothetical protein